jgi:hypothetical protein
MRTAGDPQPNLPRSETWLAEAFQRRIEAGEVHVCRIGT